MATASRLALPFDGQILRARREESGLTLKQLSDRTDALGSKVSTTSLCRWENGEFVPSAPRLAVVAKALGITPRDLCAVSEPAR